jgi:hypothetical protein
VFFFCIGLSAWGVQALRGYSTQMTKCSQSAHVQKSIPAEAWASFREVRVLRSVEQDPGSSVQRTAAAESISVPLVWDNSSCTVTPDLRAMVVFSQNSL